MTAEEQKQMQELEAENAALKEKLLIAQRTLAKYAQMLFVRIPDHGRPVIPARNRPK